MTYDLIKLNKSNKPSAKQLAMVKYNINKANNLAVLNKSFLYKESDKDKLQSKFDAIISNYDRKHKLLQDDYSVLSAKMNVAIKKISKLEFEKKFLQTKVDDLVEELMKRQSYNDVIIEKPTKFYKEEYAVATTFPKHPGIDL